MTTKEDICSTNSTSDEISSSTTTSENKKKLHYKISKEKKCELQKLIKRKKWKQIKEFLITWPAATIAHLIQEMDKLDAVLVFRCLPRDFAAEVFSEVDFLDQDALLKDLTDSEISILLSELSPDDRTDLFEELPAPVTQRLLKLLKPEDLNEARVLLGYPEESVGRLMTPDFVSIQEDWTIKKALQYIRQKGKDSEILAMIYVVDKHGKLLDELRLRQLILADPSKKISDLMNYSYVGITAFEDQEKAYHLIKEYNLFALPVIDSEGILLGIVTVDDLIDVAEEETTEDFHKIAGMSELKLPDRIRFAPVKTLFRKRIGWLMFLIFINIFAGIAIGVFEHTIATYIVLVTFMPLLIDCGGNAGAQASTLMIRALAIKDVKLSDWYYCIGKEALVASSIGVTMGIIVSFLGAVRGGMQIAVVVGLSMLIIVFVGSIVGISLPFIFTRLKWDPAVASGPLITSIADILGIVIYLFIATSILTF